MGSSLQKLQCWGKKKSHVGEFRTVHCFQKTVFGWDDVGVADNQFANNVVVTSKYTWWNFIPKNLFEQFRRIANFYFLCIVLVQFSILEKTPVSPSTSLVPLVFVIAVTALKQGFEDWKRHTADAEVNNRPTSIIKNGKLHSIRSRDIKVGDVVKVSAEEEFPCDLVVISSSEEDGQCHITTANLDGETNLKAKHGLQCTIGLTDPAQLQQLSCTVECDHPEYDMYKFNGRMTFRKDMEESLHSLSHANLLLRGARLKNTPHVYGMAVYTGVDTKMALNQQDKTAKFSCVERSMNKYLVVFLGVLLLETALCTVLKYVWQASKSGSPWYMTPSIVNAEEVFIDFLAFLILFNYVIPISLYVTVELQKFVGALFFNWDLEMYHEPTDEPAQANTSDLNEELGQIDYVFSDKTGTLTENDMQFRLCSINGVTYEESDGQLTESLTKESMSGAAELSDPVKELFTTLALCHTVQAEKKSRQERRKSNQLKFKYQASSPDEKAFVEAAARVGIVFIGCKGGSMDLQINGETTRYRLLHVLEFDSTRKRMSNIVQLPNGEYLLMCKGAESHVLTRVVDGPVEITRDHIDQFAGLGLRTLAIALKRLSVAEFDEIDARLKDAQCAITNREEKLAQVFEEIESGLTLLGATAIEDRLQDDVKGTIEALREAGIKVWVLTGDKQETAVNISHSCGHFQSSMEIFYLCQKKSAMETDDALTEYKSVVDKCKAEDERQFGLVVDGSTLAIVLKHQKDLFVSIGTRCVAVLCCRMSPLQKAQVVQVVKSCHAKPITLAIGDGANDCSMIQEAHVGFGIMGKEGRQAVATSDYAFHRFKYLKRALLVHGHYYYSRLSCVVFYFFYKNVAFITPQVLFQFFCGYSATPIYAGVFMTAFNIFFTSLPILVFGVSEKNLPPEVLLTNPVLYKDLSHNRLLSNSQFLRWMASGCWHALVIFFGSKFVFDFGQINDSMNEYGVHAFGTFVFTVVVIVTNLKLALLVHYWTWLSHSFFFVSIASYVALILVISGFFWPWEFLRDAFDLNLDLELYDITYMLFDSWCFWLSLIGLVFMCVLPDIVATTVERHFRPTNVQLLQEEGPHVIVGLHSMLTSTESIPSSMSLSRQQRTNADNGMGDAVGSKTNGAYKNDVPLINLRKIKYSKSAVSPELIEH